MFSLIYGNYFNLIIESIVPVFVSTMQRFCRVSLRQIASCNWSQHRSMSCLGPHGVFTPNEPPRKCSYTAGLERDPWDRVCHQSWAGSHRGFCVDRGPRDVCGGPKDHKTTRRLTSVQPEKEEEFVFLEYREPEDDDDVTMPLQLDCARATDKDVRRKSSTEVGHRARELQLEAIQEVMAQEPDIEFHDEGYSDVRSRRSNPSKQHQVYGTPDAGIPLSGVSCCGCGALMHCTVPDLPGYLPSEKYKRLTEENTLHKAICQRCYLLVHHKKALSVQMSKEEYRSIVSRLKQQKALVLLIVDLLDLPDSIIPDLIDLIGANKHIVVLGNKVDLLPGDSDNYLKRIKSQLLQYCMGVGICPGNKDVHLISAKTGYGIENLISNLQSSWKYKGDVYLVGMANAGKSTLFNTLLESDYCKSKATDVIHKATISPWPGTTLNLLKFPIINPTPYRMFRRHERLKCDTSQPEGDLSVQDMRRLQQFGKQGYLVGHVGRTFRHGSQTPRQLGVVEFDPEELSFGEAEDDVGKSRGQSKSCQPVEFTYNELKDAHWLYDTPGIMKEHDILSLLTEEELKMVVPTHAIVPRTFILKPSMVLFLGALARIDYLEGEMSCWFSVVMSNHIPVHITSLEKADNIYQKHVGKTLLKVPSGGEERMKTFPPLVPHDYELRGRGDQEAVADIKLSSAGWVAVTGQDRDGLCIRVHAPPRVGLSLRTPPLLPHIVSLKGERIRKSPAYKPKKPQALLDGSLSAGVAKQLRLKRK